MVDGPVGVAYKHHVAAAMFMSQLTYQAHHQGLGAHAMQVARGFAHPAQAFRAARTLDAADANAHAGACAGTEKGKCDRVDHIIAMRQLQHHLAFAVHRL